MFGLLEDLAKSLLSGRADQHRGEVSAITQVSSRAERSTKLNELLRLLNRNQILHVVPELAQRVRHANQQLGLVFIECEDDKDRPFDFVARLRALCDEDDNDQIDPESYDWPRRDQIRCSINEKQREFEVPADGGLRSLHLWASDHVRSERIRDDKNALKTLVRDVDMLIVSFVFKQSPSALKALKKHVNKLRELAKSSVLDGKVVLACYAVSRADGLFRQGEDGVLRGEWGERLELGESANVAVISRLEKLTSGDCDLWIKRIRKQVVTSRLWSGEQAFDGMRQAINRLLQDRNAVWMRDVHEAVATELVSLRSSNMNSTVSGTGE